MSTPRFPRPNFTKKATGKIRGYSEALRKFAEDHRQEIHEVAQELHIGHVSPENNNGGTLAIRKFVRLDRQKGTPAFANIQIQANIPREGGTTLAGLLVPAPVVRIARAHSQESVRCELRNVMLSALMLSSRTGENYMVDVAPSLNEYVKLIVKEISRIPPGTPDKLHPDYVAYARLLVELQKG